MKVLIAGVCGFAGSEIAKAFRESSATWTVIGVDNLSRAGSEMNRALLKGIGVEFVHADLRSATDLENLPRADWVIDAAANPSVLGGVDGKSSSRQVVEHNLYGTANLLEYCKRSEAGFILLSTSRVYSIAPLSALKVEEHDRAFRPVLDHGAPEGIDAEGISECFSIAPPLSLYGSTKVGSEYLALEYGEAFGFPVWINRCGLLAGAGQFGRGDQGIISFWLHSYRQKAPLSYIGFGGAGYQVRDCLHPRDLVPLLQKQMEATACNHPRICNVSGGVGNSVSLAQLSEWCATRFGRHEVSSRSKGRPFDLPWVVLDSARAAREWDWHRMTNLESILEEIATHAERNRDWLERSQD